MPLFGLFFIYLQKKQFKTVTFLKSYVYYNRETKTMSDKLLISTFTAMRKRFLSIAMHILPSEDDAADALQDAFCKLWPRRDDIKSSTQAEALTRTTLKNICIDKVRKRTIETIPIDEQHDVFEEESTQSYKEKQFIQVKEIIEKELTEREKEIFELKELDDLSILEIAERFKLTEGAVKMCLSRARKKIRECYRKEAEDE